MLAVPAAGQYWGRLSISSHQVLGIEMFVCLFHACLRSSGIPFYAVIYFESPPVHSWTSHSVVLYLPTKGMYMQFKVFFHSTCLRLYAASVDYSFTLSIYLQEILAECKTMYSNIPIHALSWQQQRQYLVIFSLSQRLSISALNMKIKAICFIGFILKIYSLQVGDC